MVVHNVEVSAPLRIWISTISVGSWQSGEAQSLAQLPRSEAGLLFRAIDRGRGDLHATGPLRRARFKAVQALPYFVRVALHPGRARALLGTPMHELADRVVSLEQLWGKLGHELCTRLIDCGPGGAASVIEEFLLRYIERGVAEPARIVRRTILAIDKDPLASVERHARLAGLSPRQLRHLFRQEVGVSPKRYLRIARLRRVLAAAHRHVPWSQLAAETGYCDQAHMIADFREMLHTPPESYFARMRAENG
jgi:AraC-like DNA-binding protein